MAAGEFLQGAVNGGIELVSFLRTDQANQSGFTGFAGPPPELEPAEHIGREVIRFGCGEGKEITAGGQLGCFRGEMIMSQVIEGPFVWMHFEWCQEF